MASRPGRQTQPPPPSSNRQNEYFVPRDGIDREVITADICRYLGNDALVRPGVYESPQTGQVVQGYFITAYRNLTTAMIEDLKADSARWDQERRQQTARNPVGGTIASAGVYVQNSNSPVVQYRNSDTHQSRQYYGPTDSDSSRDTYDASTPRYPGTGSAGYNGASSNPGYSGQSPYGGQGGGYGGGQPGYTTGQPQFAQSPQDPYPGGVSMSGQGFTPSAGGRPYEVVGAHRTVAGSENYPANVAYQSNSRGEPIPATTMAQGRPVYVTSGPPGQPGFPSSSGAYYSQNPASNPAGFSTAQPVDSFYGRASPAGAQTFTSSAHDPQYEPAPRNSAQPPSTQPASSGAPSRHGRDNRDSVDRHTDSRHRGHRSGR